MDLTLNDVERLMAQFESSDLREFHLNAAPVTLTLSKNEWQGSMANPMVQSAPVESGPVSPLAVIGDVEPASVEDNAAFVKAELVGTVHLQPSPDAEAFVQVGQTVQVGDQVAIIEAMKLMTPVISQVSGTIQKICVSNNDVVAYDDVLFEVTPMEA